MIKLKDLLKEGESETVEFKPSLSQMDKITESISAFSNTKGGTVVIGVSDKGEVLGVDIGKNTIESLANQIKQNTDPMAYPSIRIEESNKKQVVIIKVLEGEQKPMLAFGRGYMRVGKSNQKLGFERIRNLALETSKVHWDERVCEDASLEDLDGEKVRWFLKEARHSRGLDIDENSPVEEALLRLKLLKSGKPTNGAVLLFARDLQRRFIQSEVKCIRFKGVGVTGEMIDLRTVGGDVFEQLIEAEKFVFNNIALSAWIEDEKIQRQERWEYPPKAIREVLANAISHRDYEITSKVQVRIFDDRMEFWNPGRLPEGWNVETLKEAHESIPGNPSIARQFFWVKYIEEVGTGTNKIIEWCIDWGLPEPEFELKETSFVVTFRKSGLTDAYLEQLGLNERQKKAITHLKEHGKIDRKTYITICNVEKTLAHEELADMVNKELLDILGKGRGAYYILRTKRTITGRLPDE
ncbi:MAG: helix-turn-helix domain-containing protein [Methanosarcinales archaeon]|nr:helix-turn-helix domain-containing protein [Methanosarcinales archaeon]